MNIKSQILAVQDALNAAHQSNPSETLDRIHALLWDGLLANYAAIGLTKVDLQEIAARGNVQTFGGGTPKTPPPEG
jgi:hypothetical protein